MEDISNWPEPKTVAADIGRCAKTVIRMIDSGRLEARPVGAGKKRRRFKIDPASIQKLLNQKAGRKS